MEKLSDLARDFSLENLERYLLYKGFTVDIKPVLDIQDIEEKYSVSDIKEIGYIRLKQNSDLVVFAIKIDNLTERTSKKRQFDIAKRLLGQKFYGLFVFYDDNKNFRLSFVFKTTYGTKAKYSHYKRFTFYVSPNLPNKTFVNQLKDCDFTDLDSIKQAFSTQPITKEFYSELQNWYYYALDKVKFPDDYKYSDDPEKDREIRNAQGLIRLLTRLIFIWFLKEKGLVPDKLFDEKELKNIVKDFGKGNNYYNAILQNLFFATLNRPIKERGWAEDKGFPANKKDFGVKSLYRYEDKFLISKKEVLKLFEDIPFINGGLFDCLDKDKVYIDGFSRNEKKQAKISDELFFNEKGKTVDLSKYGLSKNAEVRGLINILKSYNFTTDEATPIDQEIALDPELLGKVFENLLASYNPETNTTARKATGSYYTPREIVDYMVEESLREYLKTKVPEAENILDDLFSYSDEKPNNISDDLRKKLIEAIDQIKIIDPACGSGAFPMGILHKLVFLLQKLDPSNKVWYELQVDRIKKESKEALEIAKDENTLKELLNEVKEHFDESINYPDYARKLYLIENCIYGVDIQPIAIQISKLRFFISLILDQKVDRNKPNFGILTLPNLETKFISANALIGLEKPTQKSFRNKEIEKLEQELKFLRHRYFRIKSRAEKIQLQNKDKELREKLKNALINDGWSDKVAEKIANFDIFDQNASADWFDPEWMFGVVDGFDIVIGNPPYGAKYDQEYKKYFLDNYITAKTVKGKYKGSLDTYTLFIEKGFNLLKVNGNLIFIVPISITSSDSVESLHNLLEKNCKIIKISSYAVRPQPIFQNSVVDVSIISFLKTLTPVEKILCTKMYRKSKDISISDILNNLKFIDVKGFKLMGRYPKISYQIEKDILQKIFNKNNTPIANLIRPQGKPIYYRSSGGRYFKVVTNYSTGSTAEKTLYFDKDIADVIGAILSSNLFFWFYQVYSDNHNLKLYEISSFSIPYKKLLENSEIIEEIKEIYNIYLSDIERNAIVRRTTQYKKITEFKEYKIKKSKHIIDKIDELICPLYNMAKEEIEFLKNYEIKFRLGDEDEN
jgi:hypothetical protein